jgi:hypothetical protein
LFIGLFLNLPGRDVRAAFAAMPIEAVARGAVAEKVLRASANRAAFTGPGFDAGGAWAGTGAALTNRATAQSAAARDGPPKRGIIGRIDRPTPQFIARSSHKEHDSEAHKISSQQSFSRRSMVIQCTFKAGIAHEKSI